MKRTRMTVLATWMVAAMSGRAAAEQRGPMTKEPAAGVARAEPAYPLKVSANGRYPVDQKGTPFLIAGESPQALMVNLTEKDAELFFANRRSHGFNTSTVTVLYPSGSPRRGGNWRSAAYPW
jgi:hypothetical protein